MKYKLLTFNEDYGDEHDVPALACFTEEEYNKWLETPSGELNPNYEKELEQKKAYNKANREFWQMLVEKGYTINGQGNTSKIPKDDLETLELEKQFRKLTYPRNIKKVNSNMYAYLGNSGEYFSENYSDYYLMKEFVEANLVKVADVSEEFYKIFHENKLNKLSLCNVFEIDKY